MSDNQSNKSGQVNPGDMDQFGNEAVIKKNHGISEQGNQWSDEEPLPENSSGILGEKAEKYIKESGDIEDLPDEEDEEEADRVMQDDDDGEDEDDVIERNEDYVPGHDLGRNKVQ
jgi:hypothetical protein